MEVAKTCKSLCSSGKIEIKEEKEKIPFFTFEKDNGPSFKKILKRDLTTLPQGIEIIRKLLLK